ncbi:hypothetical protein ACMHYJ_10160 [Castellaniella hirudinis]|uniref:antitoxin VbhA family protein n=1 Tax=Castellaniella hirudinis TaxID=1144617 RepID=UPI0039C44CE5
MNPTPDISVSPLSSAKQKRLKAGFKQVDAIFSLEGFEPSNGNRAIDAAILAGRITEAQVVEEMIVYIKEHKTIRGFYESRTWLEP